MAKHRSLVTVEADGGNVTIAITCDVCSGGTFTTTIAHLETLARVLPKVCEAVGIDLADGVTETHVFDIASEANKKVAESIFREFVARAARDD